MNNAVRQQIGQATDVYSLVKKVVALVDEFGVPEILECVNVVAALDSEDEGYPVDYRLKQEWLAAETNGEIKNALVLGRRLINLKSLSEYLPKLSKEQAENS